MKEKTSSKTKYLIEYGESLVREVQREFPELSEDYIKEQVDLFA